jgi:Prion-inhibition and propagation
MVVPVEPVSLTIGVVALASLFSTCIECFDYFKAGQALEEDFELLLVKLDVEKTCFLIWGNAVGVLKPDGEGRIAELNNSHKAGLIERCLGSIKSLLSDTDELQNLYGLRSSTGSDKDSRSHSTLSVNSMSVFKTSYRRFCARFAGSQSRSTVTMRTRWAIHDNPKFEGLVHHLKDLIDGLNQVILVKRETQDQIMHDDIVSIIDISKLRLIQSACEGTYTTLSRVASTVIEASEYGTIDRRNIEEWLGDAKGMSEDDEDTANGGGRIKSLSNTAGPSSQGIFPSYL